MANSSPMSIWQKVELILGQSASDQMYRDGNTLRSGIAVRGKKIDVFEKPRYEFANPQVDLLRRLHASSQLEDQSRVISAIVASVNETNAAIVAHALVELHELEHLRYREVLDDASIGLLASLAEKLVIEHWKFSDADLEIVQVFCSRVFVAALGVLNTADDGAHVERSRAYQIQQMGPTVQSIIGRVRYLRLAADLLNLSNPAIDSDRKELLSRLEALGFTPTLREALQELERRTTGAVTKFDFKSAMDLLRTFFEEFIEEAAKRVATTSSVPLPTGERLSHFATYNDYLKNANVTGREEQELLQRLYNYISNKGSHSLGSEPEQFHVARTMVIESSMLLAGRLQSKR